VKSTANVRLFISGSAPLLMETHQEFLRRTGHAILERYGMTETLISTSNPYDGVRKPGSVGTPLPGIAVRVAGAAGAVDTPADVTGTLEVRGPNVFAGYWRDSREDARRIHHRRLVQDGRSRPHRSRRIRAHRGPSQGRRDQRRLQRLPKEVEMELDALSGVLESAVFGVPHPDFGEGVTAVVVPQPSTALSEADLINSLQARLARYKVPKRVLLVDELPRNAMGKVQKNVLRAAYASLYARVI